MLVGIDFGVHVAHVGRGDFASEIGEGWAFWRIRDALANARITGQTPWQAFQLSREDAGAIAVPSVDVVVAL